MSHPVVEPSEGECSGVRSITSVLFVGPHAAWEPSLLTGLFEAGADVSCAADVDVASVRLKQTAPDVVIIEGDERSLRAHLEIQQSPRGASERDREDEQIPVLALRRANQPFTGCSESS